MQREQRGKAVFAFVFISLVFWLNVCGGVVHFNTDVVPPSPLPRPLPPSRKQARGEPQDSACLMK